MNNNLKIPKILEKYTFFHDSNLTESYRRWRKNRVQSEVITFLYTLGFQIDITSSYKDIFIAKKDKLTISFSYHESALNVYKIFKIWEDSRNSNIRLLKKVVNQYNQLRRRDNDISNLDLWIDGRGRTRKTIIYGSSCIRLKKVIKN